MQNRFNEKAHSMSTTKGHKTIEATGLTLEIMESVSERYFAYSDECGVICSGNTMEEVEEKAHNDHNLQPGMYVIAGSLPEEICLEAEIAARHG